MAERSTEIEAAAPALRIACLAALALAVIPGLRLLSFIWSGSEYLGYGYLVPASSAALWLAQRTRIREALEAAEVPRAGPLWVFGAAALESLGVLADSGTAAGVGVLALVAATAYALGGKGVLRALALPIGFLVFMIPPPSFLLDGALLALKSVVVQLVVGLLQLAGFSVASQGSRLFVPGRELFVANACSGLNSVLTLFPLSVVVATFGARGLWRRVVIVASVVPLAIAGNVARIFLVVWILTRFGDTWALGGLHESYGFTTFALGGLALLGIARGLR